MYNGRFPFLCYGYRQTSLNLVLMSSPQKVVSPFHTGHITWFWNSVPENTAGLRIYVTHTLKSTAKVHIITFNYHLINLRPIPINTDYHQRDFHKSKSGIVKSYVILCCLKHTKILQEKLSTFIRNKIQNLLYCKFLPHFKLMYFLFSSFTSIFYLFWSFEYHLKFCNVSGFFLLRYAYIYIYIVTSAVFIAVVHKTQYHTLQNFGRDIYIYIKIISFFIIPIYVFCTASSILLCLCNVLCVLMLFAYSSSSFSSYVWMYFAYSFI